MRARVLLAAALAVAVAACSGSTPPCDPATNFGCPAAEQCEAITGAPPRCLVPVVVSGKVVDSSTLRPVVNARVVLIDSGGVPVAAAATSRSDGVWVVRVPSPRRADETPVGQTVTPRIEASGYGTYPDGFRAGAGIATGGATLVADGSELLVTAPDVRLVSGAGGFGTGQIFGTVQPPPQAEPILVVAEPTPGPGTGASSLADSTGGYRLFGLPPGNYLVRALAKGYDWVAAPITVSSMSQLEVDPRLLGPTTSKVTGALAYVNGASGATSVVLAPAITYSASTARADLLPGLSAQVLNNAQPFEIAGVSAGTWVVLPAYPNDGLVSYLPLATVTVTTNTDVALPAALEVIAAVPIVSPGATALETVAAAPTLTWHDVTGETSYHVSVTDALGTVVWQKDEPAHTGGDVSILYQGPLVAGQLYRFHVAAVSASTQSEDLAGAFTLPAQ